MKFFIWKIFLVLMLAILLPSMAPAETCNEAIDGFRSLQLRQASEIESFSTVPSMDPAKEAADLCNMSKKTYGNLVAALSSERHVEAVCGEKYRAKCTSCISLDIEKAKADADKACAPYQPPADTAEGDNACMNLSVLIKMGMTDKDQDTWIKQCNERSRPEECREAVRYIKEEAKKPVPPALTCKR